MRNDLALTDEQLAAVRTPESVVLVIASAGGGKTEVITRRIVDILRSSAGRSFRLLLLAFTVKAAEELRSRINLQAPEEAHRVDASTVHGFALEWIRQYGSAVGVSHDVIVLSDDKDRLMLLDECARSIGLEIDVRSKLRALDESRMRGSVHVIDPVDLELFEAYQQILSDRNCLDFPEILTRATLLFEQDPWVARQFSIIYKHILIDEAQDLTAAQAKVVAAAKSDQDTQIFVVGDDRQSIYGFAGGSLENAKIILGDKPTVFHLTYNFRCAEHIVQAAEHLSLRMGSVRSAVRPGGRNPPGFVEAQGFSDQMREAQHVVRWIQSLVADGLPRDWLAPGEDPTVRWEDCAVLGRTQWTLDPIKALLMEMKISVSIDRTTAAHFSDPHMRVFLDLLALALNERDFPARRRIAEEINGLGIESDDALSDDALKALRDCARNAIGNVAFGIKEALNLAGGKQWEADQILLARAWRNYAVGSNLDERTLRGFMTSLTRTLQSQPRDPGVRLLTVHRAKGLEFRVVAVPGSAEGVFPDWRAKDEKTLNEERKSFFVAMTRSQRALKLTYPLSRETAYGRLMRCSPSRFISEAGLQP